MAESAHGGKLIQLFAVVEPTCFVCPAQKDVEDETGLRSWCTLWDQPIDSERVEAARCPEFTVDRERTARG